MELPVIVAEQFHRSTYKRLLRDLGQSLTSGAPLNGLVVRAGIHIIVDCKTQYHASSMSPCQGLFQPAFVLRSLTDLLPETIRRGETRDQLVSIRADLLSICRAFLEHTPQFEDGLFPKLGGGLVRQLPRR